ncbi:MAG: endonuclease/exonuclease/phosphatase family protein [Aestuariivirga sp.]
MTDKATSPENFPSEPRKAWWQFSQSGARECMAGLVVGLAGLFAARLGHIWVAFDVFAQFTIQFVFVAAAYLLGLLMPRLKLLAANVFLVIFIVAYGLWAHLSIDFVAQRALPEGHRELKLMSFNTWFENREFDQIRAEIERADADVVGLVEFGRAKQPVLDALASKYPHRASCFELDFCNFVILSKHPIKASAARVGWAGPPLMWAQLGGAYDGLSVIAVHTIRFPHSRAQFRQVQELVKFLETIPGRRIVMGDFNASPYSRITQTLASQTGLKRLTSLPSWPAWLLVPQIAIDHIFVSPELELFRTEAVGNAAGSDHLPITLSVAVPP